MKSWTKTTSPGKGRPKEQRRNTPWSPALLRLVRIQVLKAHEDDFVLQWNVSHGETWVVRTVSYSRSRKTGRIRFSTKVVKDEPCDWWDGTGYYIVRDGEEFRQACRYEGLPEDPIKDPWTCKNERCGVENEGPANRTNCKKCHGARFPKNEKGERDERPKVLCPRCGSIGPYKNMHGKKRADHPLRRCNFELVKYVLEV